MTTNRGTDPFDVEFRIATETREDIPDAVRTDRARAEERGADTSAGSDMEAATDLRTSAEQELRRLRAALEQEMGAAQEHPGKAGTPAIPVSTSRNGAGTAHARVRAADKGLVDPLYGFPGFEEPGDHFDGGIFDEAGTRINPADIPVPGLCILCRTYGTPDWCEELFCLLSRSEALDTAAEFACAAFTPKYGGRLP